MQRKGKKVERKILLKKKKKGEKIKKYIYIHTCTTVAIRKESFTMEDLQFLHEERELLAYSTRYGNGSVIVSFIYICVNIYIYV